MPLIPGQFSGSRSDQMTAQEREDKLVNRLFEATYNLKRDEALQILSEEPLLISSQNGEGNTPIHLALETYQEELALEMISRVDVQTLQTVNSHGDSILFYASLYNHPNVIREIGIRSYNVHGDRWGMSNGFFQMDPPNEDGKRALFVAANQAVAMALEEAYYLGWNPEVVGHEVTPRYHDHRNFSFAFRDFILARDHSGGSYLHAAAEDGRDEVILWAVNLNCHPGTLEREGYLLYSIPKSILRYFQVNLGRLWQRDDVNQIVFNWQDDKGLTPLHLAVEAQNESTIHALSSCRFLDHLRQDNLGRTALMRHLKRIDPNRSVATEMERRIFDFLLESESPYTIVNIFTGNTRGQFLNRRDKTDQTALHYAAQLRDPYFFDRLVAVGGNPEQLDLYDQTPSMIFKRVTR